VTNNSSTITNSFRIAAVLAPIVETVPRSLNAQGNLKTAIIGLTDQFGFTGEFSPIRSMSVAQPYRLVGTTFGASIDTNFWTATTGGGAGSASGVANAVATVSSGTASGATGYAVMSSVRSARFLFAHPMKFRAMIQLTSVAVTHSSARAWGPVTLTTTAPQNGAWYSVSAAGVLSVNHASGGSVATPVTSGNFNGDHAQFILDTNVHAYEIVYYTDGIFFLIDGVLVHTILPTTAVLYQTLDTPIKVWSVNDGTGGTSGTVICWNATIQRLGRDLTAPQSFYIAGVNAGQVLKTGSGVVQKIIVSTTNNNATIILYDNTAASGTILWSMNSGNTDKVASLDFGAMSFTTGLTIVTTGAATVVTIVYE